MLSMIESREQRSVACRLPQKMEAYKEEEFKLASQVLDQTRSVTIDESLERLSWLMDDLIRVPGLGWRFGLDAIVGLIPGFGDTATSLVRSEEHTSELQSLRHLVCRLLLEKK